MIIERKPKSAIVEEVMNFKKEEKEQVVEEVKEPEVKETLQESEVKPAESVLSVELEEKKCESTIECADRKAVAEQVTKLKEEHIKHKVTKKDDKFIIECFGKAEKKIDESIVKYGNSNKFLKKYGLDKYFEFDGCDLVDKKDYSTTSINFGRDGKSEEKLLAEIKELYPNIKIKEHIKESLHDDKPTVGDVVNFLRETADSFESNYALDSNVKKVSNTYFLGHPYYFLGIAGTDGGYINLDSPVDEYDEGLKSKSVKESWEGESIIDDLIDRAKSLIEEGHDADDAVSEAIDEGLIYTDDIFALAQHYGSIDDSTLLESYYEDLYSDIYNGLDLDEDLKSDVKKIEDEKKDTFDKAIDYWANEVRFQLENMEDLSKDERILKASEEELDEMAKRIAEKVLNDDNIWDVVNSAIDEYIVNDDFMKSAEIKKPEVKVEPEVKEIEVKETEVEEKKEESLEVKEEVVTEAKSSKVEQIKSKILNCLDRIGYNEKDFDEYFVIEEKEFINDEGDKATHIQIRNDLVDYYEAESYGLITDLDKIVEPGYFEPYDAYVWDAYIWKDEVKEGLHEDLEDISIDEIEDEKVEIEEPVVDEVDDEVVYFSTDEVKDVVEDVVDEIGDEMKDKEPEEVDVEEIIDEKIADAVEDKKEEDVEDDVSDLKDEEEISVDFSADDISEEDAQFLESLDISNNYKNEFKSEEQQKLDEELGEVVIKDDLGVEEDISEEEMEALSQLGE